MSNLLHQIKITHIFKMQPPEQILVNITYRWQCIKTSYKQNAQCSGNTKNCFKTNWQLSVCYFYFCHFGRLCIQIWYNPLTLSREWYQKCISLKILFLRKIIVLGFDTLPSIYANLCSILTI